MISKRRLLWFALTGTFNYPLRAVLAKDNHSRDDGGNDGGNDDGGNDDGGNDDGGNDDGGNDQSGGNSNLSDQGRALDAVKSRNAATLKEVLTAIREKYDGEIVNVSLNGSWPNLTYHIKLLDHEGRLVEIAINPISRKLIQVGGS